jgi:hypothetical protein
MNTDYCKIWYSKDPYNIGGSPTPSTGVKIISGRSRVHAVYVMNRYVSGSTSYTLTRPVSLLDSQSGNVLYEVAFINPCGGTDASYSTPLAGYQNYFGGNGMLFPDGVWIGIDSQNQSGSTSAGSATARHIAVLYTGGVNT